MKKLLAKNILRHITISQRIAIWVFLISLLPIIVTGLYGYHQAAAALQKSSDEYNRKVVDALKGNVAMTAETFYSVSKELMANTSVRQALKVFSSLTPQEKFTMNKSISDGVKSKFTRITDVYDIRIVTTENEPVYTTGYLYLMDDTAKDAFEKIEQYEGNVLWYITSVNGRPYYVMASKVIDIAANRPIGYVFCYILPSAFNEVFTGFEFGENARIALLDSFGNAISGDTIETVSTDPLLQKVPTGKETGITRMQDETNLAYYASIPQTNWTLFTSIPYEYLNGTIAPIQTGTSILVAITIVLCLFLSRSISQSITVPISRMTNYLEDAAKLKFEVEMADDGQDELGYMAQVNRQIIGRMKELLCQTKKEQEDKRLAEMKMLQAQINPHFLFNTLDSLRFAALLSNATSVSDGLSSLSHLLRNSILNEKSKITIEEELSCIQDYLIIQKIRYGECINLTTDISPACLELSIMKLLLQPIIENAVIHGIQDDNPIDIQIRIRLQEGQVQITIEDNGAGFDLEKTVDQATKKIKSSRMSGIGLENIKERLVLEYGVHQRFSIQSEPGRGTIVTLSYPAEPLEPSENDKT